MVQVDISAGGRQVVIEAPDVDLTELAETTLRIWQATEGATTPPRFEGGGLGFQIERAEDP